MRRFIVYAFFALGVTALCGLAGSSGGVMAQEETSDPSAPALADEEFAEGRIIVKLEEEAAQSDLVELNQQNDATIEENLPQSDVNVVDLPRDLSVAEAVDAYEASPDIEYAEPDFILEPAVTPNDPRYSGLWGLTNTGQTGGIPDADIDAPRAWNTTAGSRRTVVAVIDQGVDINHPDLRDNIWKNPGEIPANRVDDDRNGYVDDVHGWDFANDNASVNDPGTVKHGTHVAGTIAAEGNNGIGVTGVNWRARIMSLKFLGPKGGLTSDAVAAINYAVRERVKISNNSWGGVAPSQALRDAIQRADNAGHLFVVAAGNGGSDGIGDNNDASPKYPASYGLPNIISVAATNDRDTLASFSNYGATSVDLAAPGVSILSTLPGNSYGYLGGTSMATPHVSGVAALLKSQHPDFDDARLKARILNYADKKSSLRGKTVTGGRLNAHASLTGRVAPDTTNPTVTALRPARASSIRDRSPTVKAVARDDRTELRKRDIRLYVDGARKETFSYDALEDRLRLTTGRLSYARHTVKVVATDAAGNTATRNWSFRVVR